MIIWPFLVPAEILRVWLQNDNIWNLKKYILVNISNKGRLKVRQSWPCIQKWQISNFWSFLFESEFEENAKMRLKKLHIFNPLNSRIGRFLVPRPKMSYKSQSAELNFMKLCKLVQRCASQVIKWFKSASDWSNWNTSCLLVDYLYMLKHTKVGIKMMVTL